MCRKIEEKRGVVVTEVEPVSLDTRTMALSGPAKASVKATGTGTDISNAWDADWAAPKKTISTNNAPDNSLLSQGPTMPSPSPAPQISSAPAPSLSFEWPPPAAPSAPTKAIQNSTNPGFSNTYVSKVCAPKTNT